MESSMRKKRKYIIFIVMFLIGFSILLYPTISNLWNEYRAEQLILGYEQSMVSGNSDIQKELYEEAVAYNQSLKEAKVPDAFSVRDGVEDKFYEELLNPGQDGVMGVVEVPQINVQLPIYHYTTEEVLKKGAGHLFGSSLPVGGENTHTVITAHRGLPSAKLFTDLNLLQETDHFYIRVLGETLAYEVDGTSVVEPDETESLAIVKGKDQATLLTCTPYGVNTQRLLVRGHRVPYDEQKYLEESDMKKEPEGISILIRILCVIAGVLLAVVIVWVLNRRKRGSMR